MTQGELFPSPCPAAQPKPRKAGNGKAKYTRFQPRRRTLCDECVRDIHERGVAVAPFPQSVRWRRVATDGAVLLLCEAHRRARMEVDQ